MVVDEQNKILFVCVYQMPVMLIRIHEIIIVIYMKCLGYHIRNQQTNKIESGTFAVCKNQGTRQRNHSLPCAKASAHGKGSVFAVCHIGRAHGKPTFTSPLLEAIFLSWAEICTRQKVCRVPDMWHMAKTAFADA